MTCDGISMGAAAIKRDYFGKRGTVTARVLPRPYILTKRVLFSLAFLSPRLPTPPRLEPPSRLRSSLPPAPFCPAFLAGRPLLPPTHD